MEVSNYPKKETIEDYVRTTEEYELKQRMILEAEEEERNHLLKQELLNFFTKQGAERALNKKNSLFNKNLATLSKESKDSVRINPQGERNNVYDNDKKKATVIPFISAFAQSISNNSISNFAKKTNESKESKITQSTNVQFQNKSRKVKLKLNEEEFEKEADELNHFRKSGCGYRVFKLIDPTVVKHKKGIVIDINKNKNDDNLKVKVKTNNKIDFLKRLFTKTTMKVDKSNSEFPEVNNKTMNLNKSSNLNKDTKNLNRNQSNYTFNVHNSRKSINQEAKDCQVSNNKLSGIDDDILPNELKKKSFLNSNLMKKPTISRLNKSSNKNNLSLNSKSAFASHSKNNSNANLKNNLNNEIFMEMSNKEKKETLKELKKKYRSSNALASLSSNEISNNNEHNEHNSNIGNTISNNEDTLRYLNYYNDSRDSKEDTNVFNNTDRKLSKIPTNNLDNKLRIKENTERNLTSDTGNITIYTNEEKKENENNENTIQNKESDKSYDKLKIFNNDVKISEIKYNNSSTLKQNRNIRHSAFPSSSSNNNTFKKLTNSNNKTISHSNNLIDNKTRKSTNLKSPFSKINNITGSNRFSMVNSLTPREELFLNNLNTNSYRNSIFRESINGLEDNKPNNVNLEEIAEIALKNQAKQLLKQKTLKNFNRKMSLLYQKVNMDDKEEQERKRELERQQKEKELLAQAEKNNKMIYNQKLNKTKLINLEVSHKNLNKKILKGRVLNLIKSACIIDIEKVTQDLKKVEKQLNVAEKNKFIRRFSAVDANKKVNIYTNNKPELINNNKIYFSGFEDKFTTPGELIAENFSEKEVEIIRCEKKFFHLDDGKFSEVGILKSRSLAQKIEEEEKQQLELELKKNKPKKRLVAKDPFSKMERDFLIKEKPFKFNFGNSLELRYTNREKNTTKTIQEIEEDEDNVIYYFGRDRNTLISNPIQSIVKIGSTEEMMNIETEDTEQKILKRINNSKKDCLFTKTNNKYYYDTDFRFENEENKEFTDTLTKLLF